MMGQRLKEARKNAGLSQVDLANLIGVKPAEISQYESDKRTPRWNTFSKLLDILGVTADYMLGREITVVSDDDDYHIKLPKTDLKLLEVLKQYPKLYNELSSDPKRKFKYLNANMKDLISE